MAELFDLGFEGDTAKALLPTDSRGMERPEEDADPVDGVIEEEYAKKLKLFEDAFGATDVNPNVLDTEERPVAVMSSLAQ